MPRNVVLVTVDSLRADHCSFAGYDRETTPALDDLAVEGLVFENAVAPGPSTPESMPAVFTGQHPVERERDGADHGDGADPAPGSSLEGRRERIRAHMAARETLAERFRRRGYETAAFTPNPFTSRHFGFDHGFDRFEDFMDESQRSALYQRVFRGFLEGSGAAALARVGLNFWHREEVFKPWAAYRDQVARWVRTATEPYFLWVFLMDAHNPYMAPESYRTQPRWQQFHANVEFWRQRHDTPFSGTVHDRLVTAYDDAVRYSDAFLEWLTTEVVDEDAVVAVHGDHGEAFGEHGTYGHEPHLYPENVRVPLVVGGGGVDPDRVPAPVSLRSLPGLLGAAATGGDPERFGAPYVTARTRQGARSAVYGAGERYVLDGEAAAVSGEAVRELDRAARTGAERRRITGAAGALVGEEVL